MVNALQMQCDLCDSVKVFRKHLSPFEIRILHVEQTDDQRFNADYHKKSSDSQLNRSPFQQTFCLAVSCES